MAVMAMPPGPDIARQPQVFLSASNLSVSTDHMQGLWNAGGDAGDDQLTVRVQGRRCAFSDGTETAICLDSEDETLYVEWQRSPWEPGTQWILVAWSPHRATWQRPDNELSTHWIRVTQPGRLAYVDLDRADFRASCTAWPSCIPPGKGEARRPSDLFFERLPWDSLAGSKSGARELGGLGNAATNQYCKPVSADLIMKEARPHSLGARCAGGGESCAVQ